MKRSLIYLFSFSFIFLSCNENNMEDDLTDIRSESSEEVKDGEWKDVIGLSTKTARFVGKKDTARIYTKGLGWWFESITVDGVRHEITAENNKAEIETYRFSQTCDWLTVHREDSIITLFAASNNTGEEREFELSLQGGDYFDRISGTQAAKGDGDWEDCIGLSQKKVEFGWRGGTLTINTLYNGWWFDTVEVDGNVNIIGKEGEAQINEGGEFLKTFDWLTVHATYKKIELVADRNHEGPRSFKITLQAGDYFDRIEGIQEEVKDGDWLDCIGLSKKNINYMAEGGTITVNTEKSGWWLNTIEVDAEITYIEVKENDKIRKGEEYIKECGWLTVHIFDKKIELTVEPNATGKERLFKIYLQAGNYFDSIEGVQGK